MKRVSCLLAGALLLTVAGLAPAQSPDPLPETQRLAADQGAAKAQYNLGVMYFKGDGVPQDYAEAMKWFRLAADQGISNAQYALGLMYANGEGVPQDDQEAVKWYRQAVEHGNANAQFNLGVMYDNGEGVPQDHQEAVKWYRLAAAQGEASAQSTLGWMYVTGRGVPQDYAEALEWYRLAADKGDTDAQYGLGMMYFTGLGVPEDDVQAHKWLNLATSRSTGEEREKYVKTRELVAGQMTVSQITKAQRLAREWKPKMYVRAMLDKQIIQRGRVARGSIGIEFPSSQTPVLLHRYGAENGGVLVKSVVENGPADEAGMEAEDVIVEIDGKPVPDREALIAVVAATPVDSTVPIVVMRDDQSKTLRVTIADREELFPDELGSGRRHAEGNRVPRPEIKIRHRHAWGRMTRAVLTVDDAFLAFREPGKASHDFKVAKDQIIQFNRASPSGWLARSTYTLHFSVQTPAGTKLTFVADPASLSTLINWLRRNCPNVVIRKMRNTAY